MDDSYCTGEEATATATPLHGQRMFLHQLFSTNISFVCELLLRENQAFNRGRNLTKGTAEIAGVFVGDGCVIETCLVRLV